MFVFLCFESKYVLCNSRSGNKLRNFAAGAAGAAAGYAIMRAITGPHHSRSHHYYDRGYGSGKFLDS